ncbi:OB-fold domain-containing protein [Diaphorobacter sp.]|uniref:Zn-ribbon domain-containing OB-fold protein n=1 Tax=Diaphorobacter sp. TaxID=1934310 RepID=UPI0028AF557F|nr:OB-fold domain-containing protein [Diaphorobacter sp.]
MNDTITTVQPLAAPFIHGLAAHTLRYQHCPACGHAQTLAHYACRRCASDQLAWRDASGNATVRACTVVARAPSEEFRTLAPYTLVIAQLDEGPRLMAHADARVQIGQRVRAGFFEHNGRTLIRFFPSEDAPG